MSTRSVRSLLLSHLGFMGAAALLLALSSGFSAAFASAGDVGQAITDVVDGGYSNVPAFINYISYIGGVALAVVGALKLRAHFGGSGNNPLGPGLWHMVGASLLISLPTTWDILVRTLGTNTNSGTTEAVASLSGAGGGGSVLSLDQMMIDMVSASKAPMGYLLWSLGAVLGVFFLVSAFLRMARNGGQDGPKAPLGAGTMGRLLIGSILLSFASTADLFTNTIFGSTGVLTFSGMNLSGVVDTDVLDHANAAISASLVFVQILGFIAFMRGFLMLRAQADGASNASTAAAFTHLIGGAVAFNISSFLGVIEYTFCNGGGASCSVFNFT